MALVEVNVAYARSLRGGLKLARMIVALMATISFAAKRSHEAFLALGIIEFVITGLFFFLYFLSLQKKLHVFFWPLADAFNSLVSALFLIIVGLCATLINPDTATLVGGVFCLLLFALSVADAVVLLKMITLNKETRRNAPRR